jgi:hypothetical protein
MVVSTDPFSCETPVNKEEYPDDPEPAHEGDINRLLF